MFKKGQKYKMQKSCASAEHVSVEKTVSAKVEYVPKHGRFVSFRFYFRNLYGELTSYTESFLMRELDQMTRTGKLTKQ